MSSTGCYVNTETFYTYSNPALKQNLSGNISISSPQKSTYYQNGTGYKYSSSNGNSSGSGFNYNWDQGVDRDSIVGAR
jgi:hypothetical protein